MFVQMELCDNQKSTNVVFPSAQPKMVKRRFIFLLLRKYIYISLDFIGFCEIA